VTRQRRLLGHRGCRAELPENTLASFERAATLGVDALEMDVHLTADGVVVVAHDDSALRMTGVDRRIAAASLAEVQSWDAGWGFRDARGRRPHAGSGHRIPTLAEVVEAFPDLRLNVDLKAPGNALVDAVLGLLRALGAEERATLASFHAATMREVRRRGFCGETVLARDEVLALLACPRRWWRRLGGQGSAVQLPLRAGPVDLATRSFIARCHDLDLRVDYWTVDDPVLVEVLLDRGADGIISDDPAALLGVFARYRS
jgi:glycerophosphoryl diester phosphodiesterase